MREECEIRWATTHEENSIQVMDPCCQANVRAMFHQGGLRQRSGGNWNHNLGGIQKEENQESIASSVEGRTSSEVGFVLQLTDFFPWHPTVVTK